MFIQYPPDKGLFHLDCRQFELPKNRSLRFNQSEFPWISHWDRIVKLCTTKHDLWLTIAKAINASKAAGHHVFLSAQIFRHKSKPSPLEFSFPVINSRFKLACIAWRFLNKHVACTCAQIAS